MTQTVHLKVGGMTCAACQAHVQHALEEIPGVEQAAVHLMTGDATVRFDPAKANEADLIHAIEETGYDAEVAQADAPVSEEDSQPAIKAIVSLAIGAVAMWLSMQFMEVRIVQFALMIATLGVMAWAGNKIYIGAFRTAIHGSSDMNTLVALGTGAAFLYSAAVTLAPSFFHSHGIHGEVYYEAAILILAFVLTGKALEA